MNTTMLEVCTVCIHFLANGEYNDGENSAETAQAGIDRIWGEEQKNIVPDGASLGFGKTACELCGDTLHGDRFTATLIK